MKDTQWHLVQNVRFCYVVTENDYWPKNRTKSGATLLLLWHLTPKCLINHIRNVPEKHLYSVMECLSFSYAVTENSDSKVVIVCFRKSYL